MASRIAGITVEIGGDTTKLQSSLKGVDKSLRDTQSVLKDVNKLLKLDPGNTELLTQKQKALKSAIADTKDRLQQLKEAQSGVAKGSEEWDALQREIIATEQNLKQLEDEHKKFGSVAQQQIQLAGKKMQEFGGKVEEAGKKMQPLSTAAAGLLASIGGLAYKAITASDDLNTLAKQTGISTAELQKMQFAADRVDVSVDDITGALRKMKSKMDESNKTFETLGVSVVNADGSLRDATDVFYDAVTALSQIENETERDKVAMDLFGKGADSLAGIIDDGGAALREYGDEAERLGLVLSQDTLDALNETNDTIDRSKAIIGGSLAQFGATAAQVLAPAIEKVAGLIDKVTEKLRNLTPEQTETIMKVVGVVAAIAPALIIGGKIIKTIGMVTQVLGALNPTVLLIIAVVGALVTAGIALYKHWDEIKAYAEDLKNKVVQTWTNIKDAVVNAVQALKNGVANAWDGLKSKVLGVIDTIRGKIDALKDKFTSLKQSISDTIENIKNKFNFKWELPHIKLPRFKVRGGEWPYGLGGSGKLPSISVDWYKKAYENPIMFTSPTVMATPSGAKGFGDGHGAEIVMGLNKLQQLVGAAGDTVINIYGAQGQDVNALADAVQRRLVQLQRQREAVYA